MYQTKYLLPRKTSCFGTLKKYLTRKSGGDHQAKEERRNKPEHDSRSRKACHSINTALMQSVAKI
jgi:hypothetical protein